MNFVGHAALAAEHEIDPRFVLGAMLPDFASMAGCRRVSAKDSWVARGIAFHHESDDAFHGAPTFLALHRDGIDQLETRGVQRGAARAVAHVGPELLIDGLLLERPHVADAYRTSIAIFDVATLGIGGQRSEHLELLADRLRAHGMPDDYRRVSGVALRLEQILARRPRLAILPAERTAIADWLETVREELAQNLDGLWAEIHRNLQITRNSRASAASRG